MNDVYYSLLAIVSALFVSVSMMQKHNKFTGAEIEKTFRNLTVWVIFFCIQDAVWGIAASNLVSSRAFLFITSTVFHISAVVTAYFWTKYVISYFTNLHVRKSIFLDLAISVIAVEAILLTVNCFRPVIFFVDENAVYHTAFLRFGSFILQYVIYMVIGVVAFISWLHEKGAIKHKHFAVLLFVAAPGICGIFQAIFPDGPFYSVGFALGCSIINTFIIAAKHKELMDIRAKDLEDIISKQTADLRLAIENEEKQKIELAERVETISEQFNIVTALTENMLDVILIDLDDNTSIQIKANGRMLEKEERKACPYFEAWSGFANRFVFEEDREEATKACSIENIRHELSQNSEFANNYRILLSTGLHYVQAKFIRLPDDNSKILMGLSNIDNQIRFEQKRNETLKQNYEIIEILASEYSSVYYIELGTDDLTPYTMNRDTEINFGSIFRSGITYSEAYKLYVEKMIYPEDKSKMLKAGSIDNIITELSNKKAFITVYRNSEGRFSEMKFVKVGSSTETPTAVALGFADKDDEIRAEIEQKNAAMRNMAVISGLSDDFGYVVFVDTDTFEEYHYRFDQSFEKAIPGWTEINDFRLRLDVLTDKLVHPEDKKRFRDTARKEIVMKETENGEPFYINFRMIIDGKIAYYQIKFIREANSVNQLIAGIHNVDAETRREMAAAEKAKAASIAKTEFLFNISHDIRTPMNAILGYAAVAKKHMGDAQKVTDYLGKIEIAGNTLIELINQILEMSRIESGHCELFEGEFDIAKKSVEITSIFDSISVSKNITLKTDFSGIRHNTVYSDAIRITQIISNVLSNAFKYTPNNGTVTFTVNEEPCDKQNISNYIISVKDTGIGMRAEFLEHIFENFSREKNSTVSGIQGTGLGMSIVKRLIDLFGGTISIHSEKGKGTEMVISLPLKYLEEESSSVETNDAKVPSSLCGFKILLVDDNEMNREIGAELLEECGALVKTAGDGSSALKTIQNSAPGDFDLILMDIQMPIMNGYDATKAIRALDNTALSSIPIIAMTANAFKEDRDMALSSGMNAHIAKPINIETVTKTINSIVRK